MDIKDVDFYINYLERNIYSKRALIIGLLLIPSILLLTFSLLKLEISNNNWLIVNIILCLGWFFYWLWKREKYPCVSKGKVGIVIAVETEKDLDRTKVYQDFVSHLNKLISETNLSEFFEVIQLNEVQAGIISQELTRYSRYLSISKSRGNDEAVPEKKRWNKFQNKIAGHFYIWGNIRKRMDADKKYIFDVEGLVLHKPLGVDTHQKIKEDFVEAWFKRIAFSEIFELKGFEISAELVFVIAKYVIGLASLVSDDPFLALKLHTGLRNELDEIGKKINPFPPNLAKIKSKLMELISEEYLLVSRWHLFQNEVELADEFLEKSFQTKQDNYGALILQALRQYQKGDLSESIHTTIKAKKLAINNQIWRYDYAFLLMKTGKYEKALGQYKKIAENNYIGEEVTVDEILLFQENLIKGTQPFIPALFILGFLMYKKVENLPISFQYFEKFIEKAHSKIEFKSLLLVSKSYLAEIKSIMKLS